MEYKHFSHQHNLNIHQVQDGQQLRCSGCDSPCYNTVHACHQCNFYLHNHCANAMRYVKHPSHKLHPLILLPYPTYCGGTFLCNACGGPGKAFSYCCALCEVDLHVHCAFLPPTVTHKAHQHQLDLTYGSAGPISSSSTSSSREFCKICSKVLEPRHWSFSCDSCDFRVHTFCATTEVTLGLYQDDDDSSDTAAPQQQGGLAQGEQIEVELTTEEIVQLYNLGLQMQMAEQVAQAMAKLSTVG